MLSYQVVWQQSEWGPSLSRQRKNVVYFDAIIHIQVASVQQKMCKDDLLVQ